MQNQKHKEKQRATPIYFLGKGNYRYKIAHRNNEINKNPKRFNMGRLKEPSITTEYQQQLGKEAEKIKTERAEKKN